MSENPPYAPGVRNADEVRAVWRGDLEAVNVRGHAGLTLKEIADAGAQRVDAGDFSALSGGSRLKEWLSA